MEEEISNTGIPPQGNKGAPQEQVRLGDQELVNPLAITDGEIRTNFLNMDKAMTTQSQAIVAQENREVAPCENQNASTMASRLRNFIRMNPPMFFGSKVDKDTQHYLDEVYRILYFMGVISDERVPRVRKTLGWNFLIGSSKGRK